VILGDVASALAREDLGGFDCVVAADVLEHLIDPWAALARAAELLEPGGTAVVSLPNVRYAKTLLELVWRGRWPREDAGLFDATHLRWFTDRDARALLEGAGLRVAEMHPSYWFSGRPLHLIRALGGTRLQPFLAGQYVLVGTKL
jgi:SAM-dependent methyltransferase